MFTELGSRVTNSLNDLDHWVSGQMESLGIEVDRGEGQERRSDESAIASTSSCVAMGDRGVESPDEINARMMAELGIIFGQLDLTDTSSCRDAFGRLRFLYSHAGRLDGDARTGWQAMMVGKVLQITAFGRMDDNDVRVAIMFLNEVMDSLMMSPFVTKKEEEAGEREYLDWCSSLEAGESCNKSGGMVLKGKILALKERLSTKEAGEE